MNAHGCVFNIQKYSVHDGPGIRTLIFLKGCPLRCAWCSNPESQRLRQELGYSRAKCLHCGRCVDVCPAGAILAAEDGMRLARGRCTLCAGTPRCVDMCPAQAMICYGLDMDVNEVLRVVEQDAIFYARSGGGLTLSGGEPLMQGEFTLALLREAKKRYIHRTMETCGAGDQALLLEACGLLNCLLYDIKHTDSEAHRRGTGHGNENLLNNLEQARGAWPDLDLHIRTPLIPGFNDSEAAVRSIAALARDLGALSYELLPYHRMGAQKYTLLDREYSLGDAALDPERAKALQACAAQAFGR